LKFPMDDKQFKVVDEKLDKTVKLLTLLALKDVEKEQDKIELLEAMGFRQVDIAKLLGKSPQNVNIVLASLKKKRESASGTDDKKQEVAQLQDKPAGVS